MPSGRQSHKSEDYGLPSGRQSHRAQGSNAEKAREYAFLLLKFRLRSEKELAQRLRQKGFSEEICLQTVKFLKEREFIDDRVFARRWIAGRLKRPFGLRRIRQELLQKGLDREIIAQAFSGAKEDYDEPVVVRHLAAERLLRLKGVEPVKARQRIYAYLMRRGFSPDLINNEINRLFS